MRSNSFLHGILEDLGKKWDLFCPIQFPDTKLGSFFKRIEK